MAETLASGHEARLRSSFAAQAMIDGQRGDMATERPHPVVQQQGKR